MQIEKINIKNFKGIENCSFKPAKINVFTGKMGAGKSSCMEAISFAITGSVNTSSPIKNGSEQSEVTIRTFGTDIQRNIKKSKTVRVGGKVTTQTSVNELFEKSTGIEMGLIKLMTSSKILASMKADELSTFLLKNKSIPVEIDLNKFLTLCPLSNEAKYKLSTYLPAPPIKFDIEAIKDTHTQLTAERLAFKRELDVAKKKAIFEATLPTRSLERINIELAQASKAIEDRKIFEQQMLTYNKAIETRQKHINMINEKGKALPKGKITRPEDEKEISLRKMLDKTSENLLEYSKTLNILKNNIDMFMKTLDNLNESICPISEKLVCKTDKTAIKDELITLVDNNKSEIKKLEEKIFDLENNRNNLKNELQKHAESVAEYNKLYVMFKEYQTLKDTLPPMPEKPKAIFEKVLSKEELETLKKERDIIVAHNIAVQNKKIAENLEKEIETLNEIIDNLSPKSGIHNKIIQHILAPLEEYCNKRANELGMDFALKIEIDNGIRFLCQTSPVSGFLNLADASSGEQLCATFLVLDMFNSLSGAGIMLLDDLDKLSEEALDSLLKLISKPDVLDSYHHVFLAMVNHNDSINVLDKYKKILKNDMELICI